MVQQIGNLVRDVVASPLGDVIASVGAGVAAAQQALDDASLAKTLEIYAEGGNEAHAFLREIGYRPTFYALPETTGEVNVSLSLGNQSQAPATAAAPVATSVQLSRIGRTLGVAPRLYATPVDASYANRYGYQANISAKLTFKIVPVPAPNGADELRLMPDVTSRTASEAAMALDTLGLDSRFVDADGTEVAAPADGATVGAQDPAADSIARVGDTVTLTLET